MWCWPPPGEMSCTIKCVFVWHASCRYQVRAAQRNHYNAYFSYANDFTWIDPSSIAMHLQPRYAILPTFSCSMPTCATC